MKNGDFPYSYVSLPEGIPKSLFLYPCLWPQRLNIPRFVRFCSPEAQGQQNHPRTSSKGCHDPPRVRPLQKPHGAGEPEIQGSQVSLEGDTTW